MRSVKTADLPAVLDAGGRTITFGRISELDGDRVLCDLRTPEGPLITRFPVFCGAFQIPPDSVGHGVAFMTWESRPDSKRVLIHQSACVIPPDRYEELSVMEFQAARNSLVQNEFFALTVASPT